MSDDAGTGRRLFSIGHSSQPLEQFLGMLDQHEIEVLVDVRSSPYSQFAPQFNTALLKQAVTDAGVRYVFMGKQLGGRPEGAEFYDPADGKVLYSRLARAPEFLDGIRRLERGAERYRVAVMCSEENPTVCHRYLLIARVLHERGTSLTHIRGYGGLEEIPPVSPQKTLGFDDVEDWSWKSLRSVLPRGAPPDSSEP
jgi:uncharacterized protein (DUF488 family)